VSLCWWLNHHTVGEKCFSITFMAREDDEVSEAGFRSLRYIITVSLQRLDAVTIHSDHLHIANMGDIKRIVFLDFIHRLVSQEQTKLRKLKIIDKRTTIHTSTNKSHKDQLQTTEQLTWAHTHINP
jgi:hypothetical protein